MWDEEDGFFYDVLRLPDGQSERLKVRSMVGLAAVFAVTVFEKRAGEAVPRGRPDYPRVSSARSEVTAFIHDPLNPGYNDRLLGSVLNEANLHRVLKYMLDENEFLSPHGTHALFPRSPRSPLRLSVR